MKECTARVYGTELHCHQCGFVWDINDPEPPKCDRPTTREHVQRIADKLNKNRFTLIIEGSREIEYSSEWMAREAYKKALEKDYNLEPVLIDKYGNEVK